MVYIMHCLPFAMRAGQAGVVISGSGVEVRNLKASNLPFLLGIVEFLEIRLRYR